MYYIVRFFCVLGVIFFLKSLCGCGAPIKCSETDKDGSYLLTTTWIDGACGLHSEVVVVNYVNGWPVSFDREHCEVQYWDESDNSCQLATETTCYYADKIYNYRTTTNQLDNMGDYFEGYIFVQIVSYEITLCESSFSFTLRRI